MRVAPRLGLVTALLCAGCGSGRPSAPVRDSISASVAAASIGHWQAEAIWTVRCASCHDESGSGITPHGQMMRVPDMTLPSWQHNVNAQLVRDAIRKGVRRTGDGWMSNMPAASDLTSAEVEGLTELVLAMGGG